MPTVSDQPGRYLAVFVLAPLMFATGAHLRVSDRYRTTIGTCLAIASVIFLVYESFWISCRPPRTCTF